jgi:adenine/guanine phosphoribosyltransferase-like PRPP-binding protein
MDTSTTHVPLQAGDLALRLSQNGHRLDELLAFASRQNPRRGYLFVSKVLGKHVPVRPTKMDAIHAELASKVDLLGRQPYVVGMAETAVGLGAGVARHLGDLHEGAVFHHTTRFLVETPWIRIKEAHSHADTMHMAQLSTKAARVVGDAQDLVLVDDEISTGKTLAQLAQALTAQPALARIKCLHIVSLVSWLTDAAREALLALLPEGVEVRFVQLMAGTFTFTPCPDYQAVLPDNVDTAFCDALKTADTSAPIEAEGLYGRLMGNHPTPEQPLPRVPSVSRDADLVVFGMGEYLDAPLRMALQWERDGMDVLFQSSTRSPIMLGDAIQSCLEHPAPGQPDKRHFLYNAPAGRVPLAFDGLDSPALSQALEDSYRALHPHGTAEVPA